MVIEISLRRSPLVVERHHFPGRAVDIAARIGVVVGVEQGADGYLRIVARQAREGEDQLLVALGAEDLVEVIQIVTGIGDQAFGQFASLGLVAPIECHAGLERLRGVGGKVVVTRRRGAQIPDGQPQFLVNELPYLGSRSARHQCVGVLAHERHIAEACHQTEVEIGAEIMAFAHHQIALRSRRQRLGDRIDVVDLHQRLVISLPLRFDDAIQGTRQRVDQIERVDARFGGEIAAEEVEHDIGFALGKFLNLGIHTRPERFDVLRVDRPGRYGRMGFEVEHMLTARACRQQAGSNRYCK